MPHLDSNLVDELVEVLRPFTWSEQSRYELLTNAFSHYSVYPDINYSGSHIDTTRRIILTLAEYPQVDDRQALWVLCQHIANEVDITTRAKIESWKQTINVPSNSNGKATWTSNPAYTPSSNDATAIFATHVDDLFYKPKQLIGREDLLSNITAMLKQGQRVLLHGFGGMGKTALAATLAQHWIQDGMGAVFWLNAGRTSIDGLLSALAGPQRAQERIILEKGDARLQAFGKLMRQSGATMLVLDDSWNGEALFELLKAIPSSIAVLVTSRLRYELESIFDVGELSPSYALALLSHYAGFDCSANPQSAVLCNQLGNHAFALEIAGAILRSDVNIHPDQLLDQIKSKPHELSTVSDFGQGNRRTVKDLLDFSMIYLDEKLPNARLVFMAFGAFFSPRITPELLSLYLDDTIDVYAAISMLRHHALVTEEGEIVRVHDLSNSYVRSQVSIRDRLKALAIVDSYAKSHSDNTSKDIASLVNNLDNIFGAIDWAFHNENYDTVCKLVNSSWWAFNERGYSPRQVMLLEQALEAASKVENLQYQISYLASLCNACYQAGRDEEAIKYGERSLQLARETNNRQLEIYRLSMLGNIYHRRRSLNQAKMYWEMTLKLAFELSDVGQAGLHLGKLSSIYVQFKDTVDLALIYRREAIAIAQEVKDRNVECEHLGFLGGIYEALAKSQTNRLAIIKNLVRSLVSEKRALAIAQEMNDRGRIIIALGGVGRCYLNLGLAKDAIDYLERALNMNYGNQYFEAHNRNSLASAYLKIGTYSRSIEELTDARKLFLEMQFNQVVEEIDNTLRWLSNPFWRWFLKIANIIPLIFHSVVSSTVKTLEQEYDDEPEVFVSHWHVGFRKFEQGDFDGALKDFNEAKVLFPKWASIYFWIGRTHRQLGNKADALDEFTKAIELDPQNGAYYSWCGTTLYEQGNYSGAYDALEHALQLIPNDANNLHWYGLASYKLGKYQSALLGFSRAIEQQPTSPIHYQWRAATYRALGNESARLEDEANEAKLRKGI